MTELDKHNACSPPRQLEAHAIAGFALQRIENPRVPRCDSQRPV
jgi:hypothetical protein